MNKIIIDMNTSEFQDSLFSLQTYEQIALLKTLRKMSKLTWDALYTNNGIKWEQIRNKITKDGKKIYSFRFSQKYRGTAYREGDGCVLLEIFPNHDGAYE